MKNGPYTIGEIGKLCCVSLSKLRYYDEIGVIRPCMVDEETGYRYYDTETLVKISVLKYYQNCGFKLREIETLLQRWELEPLEPLFDKHIAALEHEIARMTIRRDSIAAWRDLIREARAAAQSDRPVRHCWYAPTAMYISTPYTWEGMSYQALLANIEQCNHIDVGGDCTVGALSLYFPTGNRRDFSRCKIYIRPHPHASPRMETETIGGCNALCCYHTGSFETGEEAYEKIYHYAHIHNIPLRGDSYERSVIDWWSTKREEEFVIEMILPTAETATPSSLEERFF